MVWGIRKIHEIWPRCFLYNVWWLGGMGLSSVPSWLIQIDWIVSRHHSGGRPSLTHRVSHGKEKEK